MLIRSNASALRALGLLLFCGLGSVACAGAARAADAAPKKLKVFIMAGQSNMQGHADISTSDYIGKDPLTAPLLAAMRDAQGTFGTGPLSLLGKLPFLMVPSVCHNNEVI